VPVTAKTSVFLTAGQSIIGTSLGGGGAYPDDNAHKVWYSTGLTAWPQGDLDSFNAHAAIWGRNPDAVRLYNGSGDSAFDATGVSGSAGAYGLIKPDWRAIANTGCALVITIKDTTKNWSGIATDLAASGSNATKTRWATMCQSMKRWHDDNGNTAPHKKLIFGIWHEPSNDVPTQGTAADFVAMFQNAVNFLKDNGIGGGPKPSSGHGSSYSGTWYDMIEWVYIDIGFNAFHTGSNAFYPGDAYLTFCFSDTYNWAGGQIPGGGVAQTHAQNGQVPQPGDSLGGSSGHYNDAWHSFQNIVSNQMQKWYENGPGGFRDVILGFGEIGVSEDIDRFTSSGASLANPQVHTGKPHLKGDWFTGLLKYARGEAYSAPDSENNVAGGYFGTACRVWLYWNAQAAGPRWYNTVPFQPGDVNQPSTAGAAKTYTTDRVVTLVNDAVFTGGGGSPPSPPVFASPLPSYVAVEGGAATEVLFTGTVVPGTGTITQWSWDPGDGSGPQVHTTSATTDTLDWIYPTAGGNFNAVVVVTDSNSLTVTHNIQVTITSAVSPLAGAIFIQPGDVVAQLRSTYNPTVTALEDYTQSRAQYYPIMAQTASGVTWTNQPSAVTAFNGAANKQYFVDLTGHTQVKLDVTVTTAGATGAKLAPYYSVDGGTTWRAFDGSATSGAAVGSSLAGALCNADTVAPHHGSYIGIPSEAQTADVLVKIYGAGGDGAADPQYECIGFWLR
jgi:hypothetical protein